MRLVVSVGSTTPSIPLKMQELFGGSVHHRKGAQRHYKDVTIWSVSQRRAATVLTLVMDALVEKQATARSLIQDYADRKDQRFRDAK